MIKTAHNYTEPCYAWQASPQQNKSYPTSFPTAALSSIAFALPKTTANHKPPPTSFWCWAYKTEHQTDTTLLVCFWSNAFRSLRISSLVCFRLKILEWCRWFAVGRMKHRSGIWRFGFIRWWVCRIIWHLSLFRRGFARLGLRWCCEFWSKRTRFRMCSLIGSIETVRMDFACYWRSQSWFLGEDSFIIILLKVWLII